MDQNKIYQEVAQVLMSHVPSEWDTLWVDAQIGDDTSEQTFDYVDKNGVENWFGIKSLDDRLIISRNLRKIRDFMAEQTGDKWKKVRFTLNADGTFKTKFEYED